MNQPRIPEKERNRIAALLKAIAYGFCKMRVIGEHSFKDAYCGNVDFSVCGWTISIFNDCDSIDYIDHIITPEGKTYSYDDLEDVDEERYTEDTYHQERKRVGISSYDQPLSSEELEMFEKVVYSAPTTEPGAGGTEEST